jgi:predicted esterase YcpF (UPF0227 family)
VSQKRKHKTSKYDLESKIQDKEALTTRKSNSRKQTLDVLFRKTDRILKKYQKKEEDWLKEKAQLVEEI